MKEKTVKTVNEETVTVVPSGLKVWDRYEAGRRYLETFKGSGI